MIRISVILTELTFLASFAHADVIYSNLGPDESYDERGGWIVSGGNNPFFQANVDVAAQFLVGAQPAMLSNAELALDHSTLSGKNELLVQVWSDANGLPGNVLASTTVTQVPAVPTLQTADFSASSVTLQAGAMYWLVADADDDAYFHWAWNVTEEFGAARRSLELLEIEGWIYSDGDITPAFRISGNVVPEPGTLVLAALGVGAGLIRRRTRRTYHLARD